MKLPQIILNAKVYPQVTGKIGCLNLATLCEQVGEEFGTIIGLAPPQVELGAVGSLASDRLQIFAQHTDALQPGSGTGWITPEAVQATGAAGSILNHAEHKIDHALVANTVNRLHALDMQTLLCADGDAEVEALAAFSPTYIAVEPPELIGGTTSVTTADPAIVSRAAERVSDLSPNTLTLCGAGVKTGKDVEKALELGAHGVLLASGVVKSSDPLAALRDLCSGL